MRVTPPRPRPGHSAIVAIVAAAGLALTACTIPSGSDSSAETASAEASAESPAEAAAESPAAPTAPPTPTPTAEKPLIGKTIYLDAGHGGPVGDTMYEQVPNGRGGTVQCQTEGAATQSGLTEQAFTWQTSQLLAADLKKLGAVVITSRENDTGSGACVDERIAAANQAGVDAFVSLHADAGPEFGYGFFVNYPSAATGQPNEEQSAELALAIRDAMVDVDLTPSTYAGEEGLAARDDLAELGLAQVPAVLVQLANMGNGIEGALLADPAVRKGYAKSVAAGLVDFLTGQATPAE